MATAATGAVLDLDLVMESAVDLAAAAAMAAAHAPTTAHERGLEIIHQINTSTSNHITAGRLEVELEQERRPWTRIRVTRDMRDMEQERGRTG
jgi:hypothetical protein